MLFRSSREHLDFKKGIEDSLNSYVCEFVDTLNDDEGIENLDFDKDIDEYIKKNKIEKEVKNYIYEAMEG